MNLELVDGFENLVNKFIKVTPKDIAYYTNRNQKGLNLYDDMMSFLLDSINDNIPERRWLEVLEAVDKDVNVFSEFVDTLKPDEDNDKTIKQGSSISYLSAADINLTCFNLSKEDGKLMEGHAENLVCSIVVGQYIKFKIVDGASGKREEMVSKNLYHKDRFLLKSHNKGNNMGVNKLLKAIAEGKRNIRHTMKTSILLNNKRLVISEYVYKGGSSTRYKIISINYQDKTVTLARTTDTGSIISEFINTPMENVRHTVPIGTDKDGKKITIDNLVRIPVSKVETVLEFLGYKRPVTLEPPVSFEIAEWSAYRIIFFTTQFKVLDIINEVIYVTPEEHPDFPGLMEKAHLKGSIFCLKKEHIEFRDGISSEGSSPTVIDPKEDILGKKKREEQERLQKEKEFDKSKGPYNLQDYVGKLVKIDSLGVEMFDKHNGKNGFVKAVDDEIGRVVIKFEHEDYYFRESQGETKHITILSDLVVSSDENPELV